MSRSYKKSPVNTDNGPRNRKYFKRQANKRIRQLKSGIPDGSSYKKVFCSWEICEFRSYSNYYDFLKNWVDYGICSPMFRSKEEAIYSWEKWYYRK